MPSRLVTRTPSWLLPLSSSSTCTGTAAMTGKRARDATRIARVQPGERSTGTWIQLFKHKAKLTVAWHPREQRFQAGQGLLDDWRRLCLRAGAQVSCRTPGSDRV